MLEWMCRELGMAERPAALAELAREAEDSAGARVLPGTGRHRRAVVAAGRARGARRDCTAAPRARTWRAPRSRASRGAWPTWWRRCARGVEVSSLRVDGGLTNEPLLLQLQADAIGVRVEAAGADATVLGAAVLAAVGSGAIGSLAEAAELLPVDRSVEPRRDDAWRDAEHERWRAFVRGAAELA